jgi:hypothetical protein
MSFFIKKYSMQQFMMLKKLHRCNIDPTVNTKLVKVSKFLFEFLFVLNHNYGNIIKPSVIVRFINQAVTGVLWPHSNICI